ncbi:MAG: hypothetical protein LBL32_03495 [Holosporales bacterium]|nr:hypothetical protein [Holosporales bacterium]
MNKPLLLSLILVVILGGTVSRIKYEVLFLRKKAQSLQSEIEKCLDDTVIYSAEWSYLNDPKRLKQLCQKHLKGMKPMENTQVINHEDLMNNQYEELYGNNRISSSKDVAFRSFLDKILED